LRVVPAVAAGVGGFAAVMLLLSALALALGTWIS
jgi:hypothetical protein